MKHITPTDQSCVQSLKLFGDFATLRIIGALSEGDKRYCEIQRATEDMNPVTLSNRLKKLEEAKLITRTEQGKTVVVYGLSTLGKKALPVLDAVNGFAAAIEALPAAH